LGSRELRWDGRWGEGLGVVGAVGMGIAYIALHLLLVALFAGFSGFAYSIVSAVDLGSELEARGVRSHTLDGLRDVVGSVGDSVDGLADESLIGLIDVGRRHGD
jgi:hypothetical protein